MDLYKIFNYILYIVIMPFVSLSFVLTTLTNDTRIFIAAEAIADNFYPLPYGWDAAYEVKPIGNRIINWILYKSANTFVPFIENHYVEFGYAVKITALIILVICCWHVSKKIQFPYAFPFLFISFACQANFGLLMSEWFSSLFGLVAIAFLVQENKKYTFAAGVLCLGIALLKSITVLMVVPIICAVYLLNHKIDWKYFISGYILSGFAFLTACLTIWPYSIGDMLMSRLIAHVGMYDITTLMQWFWTTQGRSHLPIILSAYVPILVIGFLCSVFIIARFYITDKKKFLLFCLMWAIPSIIVLIQSEFIIYHYIVMVIPAILSVIIVSNGNNKKLIIGSVTFIMISYLLINSAFGSFTQYEYTFWHQKEVNADSINAQFNLTDEKQLLYLDPGDASFYFHANSSCHYITPMPVERSTKKWDISHLPQFTETKNCILSYQGDYIVTDIIGGRSTGYFGAGILEQSEIMDMIKRNYTEVENHSWVIYRKIV